MQASPTEQDELPLSNALEKVVTDWIAHLNAERGLLVRAA